MRFISGIAAFMFLLAGALLPQGELSVAVTAGGFTVTLRNIQVPYKISEAGRFSIRDYYEYTNESAPAAVKLPVRHLVVALPAGTRALAKAEVLRRQVFPASLPALNPVVSRASDSAYAYRQPGYQEALLPKGVPGVKVEGYFWLRGYYCAHVSVPLAEFDAATSSVTEYRDLNIAFTIPGSAPLAAVAPMPPQSDFDRYLAGFVANSAIAGQFLAQMPLASDTTGGWIDYSATYAKMGVAADGMYRLTKTDLQQLSIPVSSLDPRTFKLYESGREVPIYVSGEADGTFDDQDYIEFWGYRHYYPRDVRWVNPDNSPYNPLLDRYTDTSMFFLRWGGSNGTRVPEVTTLASGITDTLTDYTALTHYERDVEYQPLSHDLQRNQDPDWTETNAVFWSYIDTTGATYTVPVTDRVPGKNAGIFVKLISAGSSFGPRAHNVALRFNNTTIDSQVPDRNARVLLSGRFSSSQLAEGNNSFSVRNYNNLSNPNYFALDWYEVEYNRYLKAVNDTLYFSFADTLTPAVRAVKLQQVNAAAVVLYKVKPFVKRIAAVSRNGGTLVFTDTLRTGDAYMLVSAAKVLKPVFYGNRQFVNLRSGSRSAGYIGVTHPSLQQGAQAYIDFIRQRFNNNPALVLTPDIYDEFGFGYPTPEAIREFLKVAFARWQAPQPSYVVLMGSSCYDYKRVFFKRTGYELNTNLVPSYGEPVSDPWMVMFDSARTEFQQAFIGRLPARNNAEILFYLSKHRGNLDQRLDLWNKRAIFFSSGDGNDTLQLAQLKAVNSEILDRFTRVAPFAFNADHFYKTKTPASDFGPYEPLYVKNAIDKGGLFISYLGHSGTRTWDNSINDPNQLLNKVGKNPLVTDFGCSTNKFAEPDVESFGALFVNTGQTVNYVGNASLGYFSTSITVPVYFYESILRDTIKIAGAAHWRAKTKMFERLGNTGVFRIFNLANLLMGDPLMTYALPTKPNLTVFTEALAAGSNAPVDQDDSLSLTVRYYNYGTAPVDSFVLRVEDSYNSTLAYSRELTLPLPQFSDSVTVRVPIKGKPGTHRLTAILDAGSRVDEMYEDDNRASLSVLVSSQNVRALETQWYRAQAVPGFKFLNNTRPLQTLSGEILLRYDSSAQFTSAAVVRKTADTFFTKLQLPAGIPAKRYYAQARLNVQDTTWGNTVSVIKADKDAAFYLSDSAAFASQSLNGLFYANGALALAPDSIRIEVISASGNFSKFGSVKRNGVNVLPNTFAWGMGIAVFDSSTLKLDTAGTYYFGDNNAVRDSLTAFITRIPNGKLVAMCVIDDGKFNMNTPLENAIRSCGSRLISSLGIRYPWVMLGRKGSAVGTANERMENAQYPTYLTLDTVFLRQKPLGTLETEAIGTAGGWKKLYADYTAPAGSEVAVYAFGVRPNNTADSLGKLTLSAGSAPLTQFSAKQYAAMKFRVVASAATGTAKPLLRSFGVDYASLPELGINYQSVKAAKDTFRVGEQAQVTVAVYNAGTTRADSVRLLVEEIFPDNSRSTVFDTMLDSVPAEGKKQLFVSFPTSLGDKNRTLSVSIDPDGSITEAFRDNNVYTIPYTVLPDTTKPYVKVLVDNTEIVDGDYVSDKPAIKVQIFDPSVLPVPDTTFALLYLNGERVYANNPSIRYTFNNANPKLEAVYRPELAGGEYELMIRAKDAFGKPVDSAGIFKTFLVEKQAKMLNAYPYPNPTKGETFFTFKLTQVPDELTVRVFTVAGRLIREIKKAAADLRIDFNKIYWDGRDADGAELANGTYLCKLSLTKAEATESVIQKVVIIK